MYKKLLLLGVALIAIRTAKAQTQKGDQNLGATIYLSTGTSDIRYLNTATGIYSTNTKGKQNTYNFMPDYSYFIADNLDLGVGLGYGHYSRTYSPDQIGSEISDAGNSYSANIALRKYFLYDGKVGIRTGPYVNYSKTKQTTAYVGQDPSKTNIDDYSGGVGLDFVFYPSKNIGLAAGLANLSYTHQKNRGYSDGDSDNFGLSLINSSLNFSIYYVFGK